MTVKFKTLKSARSLVYGKINLYDQLVRLRGSYYIRQPLLRIRKLEYRLFTVMHGLGDWSRSHRRETGKRAIVDDYLIAHAAEIRFVLDEITLLVEEIESVKLLDEHFAILDNYRIALNAAWRLDLAEPEEHERARLTRPPVVRVRWQEPEDVRIITDEDLLGVARLLGDVVQAKRAAEVALLFGPAIDRIVWN